MSEHVRSTVAVVHESLDVAAELAALRRQMQQVPSAAVSPDNGTEQRELAAARDAQILAQILARVRAQLAQRGGAV